MSFFRPTFNRRVKSSRARGTVAISIAAAVGLISSPAVAATVAGFVDATVSTIAVGETLTVSAHPTMYSAGSGDLAYWCDSLQSGDTSSPSSSGWSAMLMLQGSQPMPVFIGTNYVSGSSVSDLLFDGPGVGNFAPWDTITTALQFDFVIPNDLAIGNYTATLGCLSPAFRAVSISYDPSDWASNSFPLTVTGSTNETDEENLAPTGPSEIVGITAGAIGLAALIFSLAIRTNRRARN